MKCHVLIVSFFLGLALLSLLVFPAVEFSQKSVCVSQARHWYNEGTAVLCFVTEGNIFFRTCSFSWRRKISLIKFDYREYLFNGLSHLGNLVLRECELKLFIFSS